jgi:hypothetical protein
LIVGPLAGAAVSTAFAKADGRSWDDALQQGITDGLIGALPGGKLAGGALERLATGSAAKLGLKTAAERVWSFGARNADTWGLRITRGLGRGAGAAVVNAAYNAFSPPGQTAGVAELPIKPIS